MKVVVVVDFIVVLIVAEKDIGITLQIAPKFKSKFTMLLLFTF
jgi:hypothetical protein